MAFTAEEKRAILSNLIRRAKRTGVRPDVLKPELMTALDAIQATLTSNQLKNAIANDIDNAVAATLTAAEKRAIAEEAFRVFADGGYI